MKKIIVSASISMLMFLLACAPDITTGKIIDKEFHEAYSSTHTTMVMSGKTTIPVTTTDNYPDEWVVIIEGRNEEKELVKREVEVTEKEYQTLKIGDIYTVKP